LLGLPDETIHLPSVYICNGVRNVVRATVVLVIWVVKRLHAPALDWVRTTGSGRYAVGARICPEVGVKRTVLLHDDDHMLDVVDAY
jgi:hypothetical protein